ncbi:unnamed protein product, partial [Discosporangium mesarthrocarpum]
MSEEDQVIQISPQEDKELKRVYDRLCDFSQKEKIRKEIQVARTRIEALSTQGQTGPGGPPSTKQAKLLLNDAQVQTELASLNEEIRRYEEELGRLETNPDKTIKAVDVWENMKFLGNKCSRKEITDIVWEIDDNLDQMVDWSEFRLMFHRNINDKTGLEPSKLYNMVQFMLYDVDNNGAVSVDETMNMLYARYGRTKMEAKLKELFGESMRETGTQGGEITFLQYLEAVERTQLNVFVQTSVGRAQLTKTGK